MDLSIIIINYKSFPLTKQCLDSLLSTKIKLNYEILVVDNNSNDQSFEKLSLYFSNKVILIKSDSNLGFARGNNLASKSAKGEVILFLNNDTIVNNDIFSSAIKLLRSDQRLALISPIIITPDNKEQDNYFGHFPNLGNTIFKKKTKSIEWLSGCCLFIKRNIFQELNGFDENFFLYFEDVDLCLRSYSFGYKLQVDNESKIIHLGGKSLESKRVRKKHYYKSQNYYFKKHFGKTKEIIMRLLRVPKKMYNYYF